MRQFLENLVPFRGVASAAPATVEIVTPEPMRLHGINLKYTSDIAGTVARRTKAQMLTEVSKVELFINNKLQRDLPIAELFEDEEMRGRTIEDGIIPIRFSRDERDLSLGRDATSFFTEVGDELRVKVTLLASTTPDLVAELVAEPFAEGEVRNILKRRQNMQLVESVVRTVENINKTGVQTIFEEGNGRDLSCLKIRSANVSQIAVYRGVDKKWEGIPADFDRWMKEQGYTPQAGVIHFFPEAYGGGRFQDIYQFRGQKLRIEVTMTAATAFDVVKHEIGDAIR
jgi:hypothetical protein